MTKELRDSILLQNQWEITYDFAALRKDFDFFALTSSSLEYKTFKAKCVLLPKWKEVVNFKQTKACCFLLTEKNQLTDAKQEEIKTFFSPSEIKFSSIDPENVTYPNGKNRYLLTCLILGALSRYSPRNGLAQIDGNTCFFKPEKVKTWHFYNRIVGVVIEPCYQENRFLLKARSFAMLNEINREKATQFYQWNTENSTLQRVYHSPDPLKVYYCNRGVPNVKAVVPHLDLQGEEQFLQTKVGVLATFMEDMETYLGKYVILKINSMENVAYFPVKNVEKKNYLDYLNYFKDKKIYVLDLVNSSESQQKIANLLEALERHSEFSKLQVEKSSVLQEGFSLVVVHNKEFYEKNQDKQDPYLLIDQKHYVQHVTLEDFDFPKKGEPLKKASFVKLLQEFVVKEAWMTRQLTPLTSLDYFVTNGPLNFSCYFEETKNCYGLFNLRISGTGKLCFNYYNSHSVKHPITSELASLEILRNKRKENSFYENYSNVKGFVYKDREKIAMIYESNWSTLPDLYGIEKILQHTKRLGDKIFVETVRQRVAEFVEQNNQRKGFNIQKVEAFLQNLQKKSGLVEIRELREGFDLKTHGMKALNYDIFSKFGFYLWPPIRLKDLEDLYGNLLGINCFSSENKGNPLTCFFVGVPKSQIKNTAIPRTTVIREFIPLLTSSFTFEEIVPLFDVDFVKSGSYTVLPFPFKILKEQCQLEIRKSKKVSTNL